MENKDSHQRDYSLIESDIKSTLKSNFNVSRAIVEFIVFAAIIVLIVFLINNRTLLSSFFPEQKQSVSCTYEDVYKAVSTNNKEKIKEFSQSNIDLSGRFIKVKSNCMYLGPIGGTSTSNYIKCDLGESNSELSNKVQSYGIGSKVTLKGKFTKLAKNQMCFVITEFK